MPRRPSPPGARMRPSVIAPSDRFVPGRAWRHPRHGIMVETLITQVRQAIGAGQIRRAMALIDRLPPEPPRRGDEGVSAARPEMPVPASA